MEYYKSLSFRRMLCPCFYLLMMFVLSVCVHGEMPSSDGFLNIDCGLESNTSYIDSTTGLKYVSDDRYIDTGVNGYVSSLFRKDLDTFRSFPNNTKNCYTLTPIKEGSKYLVRAIFYYGNFDGSASKRSFDLYFDVNFWYTVVIDDIDVWFFYEIIAIAAANYIQVCLVNTGNGIPFISVLELRPFSSTIYPLANSTQSLNLYWRANVGSNNDVVRFPDDAHDRIWLNYTKSSWTTVSTNSSIDGFIYELPSLVLQTAAIPSTVNGSIDLGWLAPNNSTKFFVVLHFAEIQILQNNSLREFYVYANGIQVLNYPVPMIYLNPAYVSYTHTRETNYNLSLKNSPNATIAPLLNALELYTVLPVILLPTHSGDVTAINSIKASYNVSKNWSGDPCVPITLGWAGVNCTSNSSNIPRITVLNLSSTGLTGKMVSAFGSLTALEILDLSHNNLSGSIPRSLDQLVSLMYLDLSENSGLLSTLPPGLLRKRNSGLLTVNLNGTASAPETKQASKAVIIIIVAVVIFSLIVVAVALCLFYMKKHKHTRVNPPTCQGKPEIFGMESSDLFDYQNDSDVLEAGGKRLTVNKRQFSFAELKHITSDFSDQIGIGGFGKVFKGRLENGQEVAVKMHSESSSQGVKQFLNEVENLSRVHHKNIVSLIGYCSDKNHIALVYEYMQEGNLQDWLRGGKAWLLSWKQRLQIAYESAQGLEYLHKMCNPPLIHRDVKTNNILLTGNLEGKISDFGSVRVFSGTCVSTQVIGTPGYVDPNCATSLHVTEKSDVYTFGVVLLEIITGKSPILEDQHLTEFVKERLSKGNIESILDQNMKGHAINLNSIWKVADLALKCTDRPAKRPDMTAVVMELKESLDLEISSNGTGSVASEDISQYSGY